MPRKKLTNTLAGFIIISGIFLVLYTTLFPFDFILRGGGFLKAIGVRFDFLDIKQWTQGDLIRNILLFVPVGFGLTHIFQVKLNKGIIWLAVTATGFGLSVAVELLQVLLPQRDPSLSDVVTNSLGTFLGYLIYCQRGRRIFDTALALIKKGKWLGSTKLLAIIFVGYAISLIVVSVYLQSKTNLHNWDVDYPLVLGNEPTGDRPWQGHISELYISNRVASKESIDRLFSGKTIGDDLKDAALISYHLDGTTDVDSVEIGPRLSWRGSTRPTQHDDRVLLTPTQWLQTTTPVKLITEKIQETSQFTLSVIFSSASTTQKGPARIVSISIDPYHRNFTLGQRKRDISIRLRTPYTGKNGDAPELVIPGVVVDRQPHQIVVTYNGSALSVFVDGTKHHRRFDFTPEVMLFGSFFPITSWRTIYPSDIVIVCFNLLYYGLVFVPQGMLLGMITTSLKRNSRAWMLSLGAGLLLPSLFLEGGLAHITGNMIRKENIVLGLIVAAIATYASAMYVSNFDNVKGFSRDISSGNGE